MEVAHDPITSDDDVGAELTDVLGRAAEPSTLAEQAGIGPQRAEGPDLTP